MGVTADARTYRSARPRVEHAAQSCSAKAIHSPPHTPTDQESRMLESLLNINPERIVVTELFGAIGSPAKTTEYIRMLRAVEENKRIKAMVIDIDSPGGAAGPSEYIARSVARVAEKKPVVAFVRGMGASGGYMVAAAATKVVAVPMALVGSIGVISMRPMLMEMLDKIGVRMEVTKSGRLKDMFSNFREPTDEERVKEQALLDAAYDRFVEMIADMRKLEQSQVRELATGEIFTAQQAKDHGLIDDLGDLDNALDMAQNLAGMTQRKVTYMRPHRGQSDRQQSNASTKMA
jgi:protease-4